MDSHLADDRRVGGDPHTLGLIERNARLVDQAPPPLPLSYELRTAAEQLAADVREGALGLLLGAGSRGDMIRLSVSLLVWAEQAEGLEEAARQPSSRERRRWWKVWR